MFLNDTKKGAALNAVFALVLTALFFGAAALFYDFTYGVIDDPFIATVLNGAYTGTPDAHVVYIKYPLAWILMTLFTLIPAVNWHFLLLEACFAVCIFVVTFRICSHTEKIVHKILLSVLFLLLFWLCMGKMILTAHYSMCAAVLTAAGIFFFATIRDQVSLSNRVLSYAASLAMLYTAYALRARTLFMLLPLAAVVFFYRFFKEKTAFSWKKLIRWFSFPVILFLGIGAVELVHNSQYQSDVWQEFLKFNDARTTLYDFYGLPDYDSNQELYASVNVSEARKYMYDKYYLEFQNGVPEDGLTQIADGRVAEYNAQVPFGARILSTLKALPQNLILKTYAPVNWICGAFFIIILLAALLRARWKIVWTLVSGLIASLIPWLWMIYMGKPTSRVTMGIWAADLLFLLALVIDQSDEIRSWVTAKGASFSKTAGIAGKTAAALVFAAALIAGIASGCQKLQSGMQKTIASGQVRSALEKWCESHPENLYICESEIVNGLGFDVREVDNSLQNLYWPGGWTAKMAQSREIWARYGINNIENAVAVEDNVFIAAFAQTDMSYWTEFYQENHPDIRLIEVCEIDLSDTLFKIYQLQEN